MEHVNRRPESIIGNAVWEFFTSPDDVVQSRTVEAMKRVGVGQPEVVDVLLHANTEREHRVRSAATRSLAKIKPNEQDLLRILPALTQYLHGQREYVWLDIMDVLGALLSGRAIPGYRWKSLQKQNERRQRLQSWGRAVLVVFMFVAVAVWLTVIDPAARASRFVGALVAIATVFAVFPQSREFIKDLFRKR